MSNHPSLWSRTASLEPQAPLAGDLEVDVAIIGAGITGLTAALLLARGGAKVAVLEASQPAAGVTSSTSAHLTEALDTRWHVLRKSFGDQGAALAARSQREAIDRIAAFVSEEQIACDFRRVPGWLFAEEMNCFDEIGREAEAAQALGIRAALGTPALPFAVKAALRFEDQAQFHSLRYLAAIAKAAQAGGVRIFGNTRALEITDGEPCRVRTASGTVTAKDVFVATHSPVNDRLLLQTKLAQYRSYVVAARMSGPPLDGLYWDTLDPYHYLRSYEDGDGWLLIAGGEDHKVGQKEDTFACYGALSEWVRQRFPALSSNAFEETWSAQVVETVDGLPYVGRNPGDGHVWVATGFSGNGLTHGTMSAMLIGDLIAGRDNPLAALYDPSRLKPVASLKEFVKENVDFPRHFVGDRIKDLAAGGFEGVPRGEGKVVQRGTEALACYRDEQGDLTVLSAVCTHMGCHVGWNKAEKSWDCPCHGARFDPQGAVLDGPANAPLPKKPA